MGFLSGSKSVQVFLPFAYICIVVGDPVIKRRRLIPIDWFNPATCCACPKPRPGFPTSYVVVPFCVQLK